MSSIPDTALKFRREKSFILNNKYSYEIIAMDL
jgi:hypothetical protein